MSAVRPSPYGRRWRQRLAVAFCLAALAVPAASKPAFADAFTTAPITFARVEWRGALDQLNAEIAAKAGTVGYLTFARNRQARPFDPRRYPALQQLNAITAAVFSGIGRSPVPVLLPFDAPAYLADRIAGAPDLAETHYQSGFRRADLFEAGPAGYDAVFSLPPHAGDGLRSRVYSRPIEVHITGSLLTYDIGDPLGGKGEPVKSLANQYPDLRRLIREGFVRYAFTRFGVPYVVSINCLDSVPRSRRLACREASVVAEHFLRNLRVIGGKPTRPRIGIAARQVERPPTPSPDFTYRPPGDLINNSSYRGKGGKADWTVYSQIRFPIDEAPAFANSQSFMNWGDCYLKGRTARPNTKGAAYRCKLNDKKLVFDESAKENYSYPWQDNFCETRDFEAGQCPAGYGHQGQDIRPATCTPRNGNGDRCLPDRHAVVAVRDGALIRARTQQAALVLVNTRAEHIRFRYMHMNPAQMDADGVLHGRRVSEGEKIGVVSNYQDYPGGTSVHLHFDVQVFTRDGWIWVNPYVTLISAYERLIGGHGREFVPSPATTPDNAISVSHGDTAAPVRQEGGETAP